MNIRSALLLALLCSAALPPLAIGAAPSGAAVEIAYLIGAVESSHCEFARNGRWYDADKAAAHLREKYQWLTRLGQIDSAEQFIEKIASKSSFSGQPYMLRCPGAAQQESAQWLRASLGRYRLGATQTNAERQP